MSFQKAFQHILGAEGRVYTETRGDKGGPTKYGVTLRTLSLYRDYQCTAQDVRDLTESEAMAIYRTMYWDRMNLSELPEGLQIVLFDQGVNRGPEGAVRTLQAVLGAKQDGILGPITKGMAISQDEKSLIWSYLKEASKGYHRIVQHDSTQLIFLQGWLNRLAHLAEQFVLGDKIRPLKSARFPTI